MYKLIFKSFYNKQWSSLVINVIVLKQRYLQHALVKIIVEKHSNVLSLITLYI